MKKMFSSLRMDKKMLAQFAIVFVAFFTMVLIGSIFGTRIVTKNVASYGEEAMNSAVETVTAYLGEYETTLNDVAFSIERSKKQGADIDELQADLASWTSWIMGRKEYESFLSIYCAIGSKMIDGQYVEPPEGYVPESRPWHIGAVEKNGETHFCDPYVDVRTGEIIITVSKLMFDENGEPFGVIAIDAFLTSTTDFVKSLRLLDSGYGILLDANETIVIHPDDSLINTPFGNINNGLGGYAEISSELAVGRDISAFQYTSYTGSKNVAFFKQLFNGWYIGIISPSSVYFNDVYAMVAFLAVIGLVMTVIVCVVLAFMHVEKNRSDEANKIKTSFLANMSHEIRTPMNAIIGMSELLLNESLNNRQQGYVKDINVSSHSLLSIINDILDLSKVESGKIELNPVNYDFRVFIDNICSTFRYVSQKKGLEFFFETEGEMPKCLFGDDIRLRQVLTNICGNSVKFTSKGYVRLKITATDDNIVFEICDTGIGIHKEDIPKMFEPYVQSENNKNRNIEGTGLGLTISKSFIEMMGGKVAVSSEYGKGTVFTILIPKTIGDENEIKYESIDGEKETFYAPSAKILVVDDNELNLKAASGLLKLYNIDIITANSGMEATRLVKETDFDIVFMDHMMPEMDGVETVNGIRKLGGKFKKLTIVALTANTVRGAREMFMANGFDDFISKPIEMDKLDKILRRLLPPEKMEWRIETELPETGEEDNEPGDGFLDRIKEISGISTEIGLTRVSNSEEMYREMVELFHKKLLTDCENMSRFLKDKDLHNFAILVHGMKSSLSTIGAMALSEVAYQLEMASKNEDLSYCEEHFPDFLDKLRHLHIELSKIVQSEQEVGSRPEGNIEDFPEKIQKILAAVDGFDEDGAIEGINELLEYDFGEQINTLLENAKNAVNDYSFDEALDSLNDLKEKVPF